MATRDQWRARFWLARPSASDAAIERAIDDVLADPYGSYAREITETAARRDYERQGIDYCHGTHHSSPHRGCLLR